MALSDSVIADLILNGMIENAPLQSIEVGIISYGLSSSGYDVRIGYEFKVFKTPVYRRDLQRTIPADNLPDYVLDPKNPNENLIEEVYLREGEVLILNPGEYAIGPTVEYFRIPRNVMVIVLGKSTYARSQILINCTPAESEWEGHLAVEIANIGSTPVAIYGGEGIAQFVFFRIEGEVLQSYADKKGKYQAQKSHELLSKVK